MMCILSAVDLFLFFFFKKSTAMSINGVCAINCVVVITWLVLRHLHNNV
jgi:hypothetical protein